MKGSHTFFSLVPRHSFPFLFVLFAQDLLYRRARALADYENSNKALDKARLRSKDIPQAEEHQQQCLQKFDKLSESGKKGLCVGMWKTQTCLIVCQIFQRAWHFDLDFVTANRAHHLQRQASCGLQEELHRDDRAWDKTRKGEWQLFLFAPILHTLKYSPLAKRLNVCALIYIN